MADSAWAWWEKRRLGYNVALGLAGWSAYALNIAMFALFKQPLWFNMANAAGVTLFLGAAFLVLMAGANILYLLGVLTEAIVEPDDRARFRRHAFALGLCGSIALPFLFPLANLAFLIGNYGLPF
jgi:hypothetical protein